MQSDLREYAAARKSHEEALAIRRRALPEGPPRHRRQPEQPGDRAGGLREYAAARKSHEEALAIRRRALPKDHPDIARSLNNLGIVQDLPAGIRGGEGEPRGGAGHPPQGPAPGPSRHRREPERLGLRPARHAGLRGGKGRATRRRWPSAEGHCPRTTPTSPKPEQPGDGAVSLREYAAAKKSYEEALAIRRRALPKDHPDIAGA